MSLPIVVPPQFRIIAHRGASAYAPENTMAAFELAARMGVTEVELDVQLTQDGQLALCHDTTLDRYGHGPRVVEEMTWPELAAQDMGSWFSPFLYGGEPMIRLNDLFTRFGADLTYHVELKGRAPGLAAATHRVITRFGLAGRCIVTSFSFDALAAMRAQSATMRLGWLVQQIDADSMDRARELDLYQLCPDAAHVTPEMVPRARAVVAEVRTWGLLGADVRNQAATVQALIRRTVDAGCDGMTINWPDWVANRDSAG